MVDDTTSGAANAPVTSTADLQSAGAVGAPSVLATDIAAVTKSAADAAVIAVSGNGNHAAAITELAGAVVALGEHAAAAANPIAGVVADAAGPEVIAALSAALNAIASKIGMAIPHEMQAVDNWLAKL